MIKILQTKSGVTKFQVLIEIAAHQPNVRQKEIAAKIGITPQAVSEYIKELVNVIYGLVCLANFKNTHNSLDFYGFQIYIKQIIVCLKKYVGYFNIKI